MAPARAVWLFAGVPYLVVFLAFALGQRWLLYPTTHTDRLTAVGLTNGEVVVSDITVNANDGLPLHGWHFTTSHRTESRPLVLYFPGNSGCRGDRLDDCRELARLGCDVLICDYRGYGDNEGSPNEEALAEDALEVWTYAVNTLHVPPGRIVLLGESLGGAVAVRLAADLTSSGTPAGGLVLNSTFASLSETVAWHYPAFPFQYVLLDRYPSAEQIQNVTCPLLQFHGSDDEMIPSEHGRALFDAAPPASANGTPKRFVMVAGGTHNAIPVGELDAELKRFLHSLPTSKPH
jgi:fermentation-respiration switch protein FrsA (DUF1100 family)